MNQFKYYISTLLGLITGLGVYLTYVSAASPQVPYMDTIRIMVQLEQILHGELSWLDIHSGAEHKGLLYQVVTLMEWIFYGLDSSITSILTGIITMLIFCLWSHATYVGLKSNELKGPKNTFIYIGISLFTAFLLVSPAGFELWTLDLGFAQLIKNLLIILFLYHLSINIKWLNSWLHTITTGAIGSFLVLFCTYAWSYSFVIACLFIIVSYVIHHRTFSKAVALAMILIISQGVYISIGETAIVTSIKLDFEWLLRVLKALAFGAGTTFSNLELINAIGLDYRIVIAAGLTLLLACCFSILTIFLKFSPTRLFMASLIVFGLVTLLAISVARSQDNFMNAGAGRYYVDYVWLIIGPTTILIFDNIFKSEKNIYLSENIHKKFYFLEFFMKRLIILIILIAFIGHALTTYAELKKAVYRAAGFQKMAEILLEGIREDNDALMFQSSREDAAEAVRIAQTYQLGSLRKLNIGCNLSSAILKGEWSQPDSNNWRWVGSSSSALVAGCKNYVSIGGYLPPSFKSRNLKITLNGKTETIELLPGHAFSKKIGVENLGLNKITLEVDTLTNPLAEGLGNDPRDLGALITYIN